MQLKKLHHSNKKIRGGLRNLYDGLLLGDYTIGTVSDMGVQHLVSGTSNTPGNKFFGRNGAGSFHHASTMTINSNPPPGSLWVNSGMYFPFVNLGVTPISPFNASQYTPYACNDCINGGGGGGGGEQGAAEMIALNTNQPNSIDEKVMKWESEKELFEKLLTDSALTDTSIILENFMDTTQYNNKDKFGDLTNNFHLISEERLSGTSYSVIDVMVNDAINKNTVIIPAGDHEEFQKTINEIVLNTVMREQWQFTQTQWDVILLIANSCPYIYGPAVYEAQAIATSVNPELTFDHNVSCNPSSFRKKNTLSNSVTIVASIFPNPASSHIDVVTSLSEINDTEFRIINSLGELVHSRLINNSNDLKAINISKLSDGIYSCYLTNKQIIKLIGKLTIIR